MVQNISLTVFTFLIVILGFSCYYSWKNKPTHARSIGYGILMAGMISLDFFMIILKSYIKPNSLVGRTMGFLNFIILTIIKYIPLKIFVYFLFPLAAVWIVIGIMSFQKHQKNKKEFNDAEKLDEENDNQIKVAERSVSEDNVSNLEQPVIEESEQTNDESDLPKGSSLDVQDVNQSNSNVIGNEVNLKQNVLPIGHYDVNSAKGLKEMYVAAKSGLQIAIDGNRKVALYINKKGEFELKKIFTRDGIDISELENQTINSEGKKITPLVFWDNKRVEVVPFLKHYKEVANK